MFILPDEIIAVAWDAVLVSHCGVVKSSMKVWLLGVLDILLRLLRFLDRNHAVKHNLGSWSYCTGREICASN